MAADPLDALRLALMQDVLPVGLAVVERARRGGPAEVIAALNSDEGDPLDRLRQEGEPVARQVRDNLDRFQPGLGNPVVKVSVRDVPESPPPSDTPAQAPDPEDPAALQQALARIAGRLTLLESRLLPSRGPADPEGGRVS